MADWDDEDFDPEAGFTKSSGGDKWEGEDEEDDVKDDWAASDDEKKEGEDSQGDKPAGEGTAFQVKKKKNTLEEALQRKAEKRKKKQEAAKEVELTPEEQMAEKLRQQKLVEESDFELAKEAFGIAEGDGRSLDAMHPTSYEEFEEFGKLLKDKLAKLETSEYYPGLLEDVFQACCVCLDADQVKKLGSSLTAIGNEKSKVQQKAAKSKKGKKKAALAGSGKTNKKDDFDADLTYGDEFDDFM